MTIKEAIQFFQDNGFIVRHILEDCEYPSSYKTRMSYWTVADIGCVEAEAGFTFEILSKEQALEFCDLDLTTHQHQRTPNEMIGETMAIMYKDECSDKLWKLTESIDFKEFKYWFGD